MLLLVGWQWLFVVNLPIAAVVIILSLRELLPTRTAQRSFDWPGMATLGVLLAALAYGINQIDTANLADSLAASGGVGLPADRGACCCRCSG